MENGAIVDTPLRRTSNDRSNLVASSQKKRPRKRNINGSMKAQAIARAKKIDNMLKRPLSKDVRELKKLALKQEKVMKRIRQERDESKKRAADAIGRAEDMAKQFGEEDARNKAKFDEVVQSLAHANEDREAWKAKASEWKEKFESISAAQWFKKSFPDRSVKTAEPADRSSSAMPRRTTMKTAAPAVESSDRSLSAVMLRRATVKTAAPAVESSDRSFSAVMPRRATVKTAAPADRSSSAMPRRTMVKTAAPAGESTVPAKKPCVQPVKQLQQQKKQQPESPAETDKRTLQHLLSCSAGRHAKVSATRPGLEKVLQTLAGEWRSCKKKAAVRRAIPAKLRCVPCGSGWLSADAIIRHARSTDHLDLMFEYNGRVCKESIDVWRKKMMESR